MVEDDPATRALILEWLPEDARHLVAPTLAAARALLADDPPDLVLLDLHLPDGEGVSLIELIPPRASIIAMSGSNRLPTQRGRVVSYLPKPFEPDALRMLVRQALRALEQRS